MLAAKLYVGQVIPIFVVSVTLLRLMEGSAHVFLLHLYCVNCTKCCCCNSWVSRNKILKGATESCAVRARAHTHTFTIYNDTSFPLTEVKVL